MGYGSARKGGKRMATSSIFAKIELKDPERVRAFVDALCSDKPWPQPRPTVHAVHMTSDEWKDFFARGPYGKKVCDRWHCL